MRDEFNINLDRLSVLNLRKSDVRNQFLGMLFIWQERCREYFGVECYEEINLACNSIRSLVRGDVVNHKKIIRSTIAVVLGGVGILMILGGILAFFGKSWGLYESIYFYFKGVPWRKVGLLTIGGLLLVIFSIWSKKQDDEITLATSIAYGLLDKVGPVKN